jgi:hypothetical protein
VIQKNLIPAICNLLDIGKPGMKPYKLDLWELDTFLVPRKPMFIWLLMLMIL